MDNSSKALLLIILCVANLLSPVLANYDTKAGRFLQKDPLGTVPDGATVGNAFSPETQYKDGLNGYQYVGSKPVMSIDPSGLTLIEYPLGGEDDDWGEAGFFPFIDNGYYGHNIPSCKDWMSCPQLAAKALLIANTIIGRIDMTEECFGGEWIEPDGDMGHATQTVQRWKQLTQCIKLMNNPEHRCFDKDDDDDCDGKRNPKPTLEFQPVFSPGPDTARNAIIIGIVIGGGAMVRHCGFQPAY